MPLTSDAGASPRRAPADRCPGVLRLIEAADGYLARVRLPGGLITAAQLRALARLAGELGDGRIELTSRGNVQLRALPADAAARLTKELAASGLLPALGHDRVRNVLASPLAGLDGGPDLTPVIRALDAALCARPRLAELSGRFLFAIDDGRGDVAGLGADIVAMVRAGEASVNGLAVSRPSAPGVASADGPLSVADDRADAIAAIMLAFAEAFLEERAARDSAAWRIADLPGGVDLVRATVAERFGLTATPEPASPGPLASSAGRPAGVISAHGAAPAVVLLAPLGRLTVAQVGWLADHVTGRAARVTPWRSVVLPDQAGLGTGTDTGTGTGTGTGTDAGGVLREAAARGFGVDARSPWLRVTACAGRPGCASALADVQADAAGLAARWPGRIVHVSGCARHCGRPAATEVDVTATSEGYEVAGV